GGLCRPPARALLRTQGQQVLSSPESSLIRCEEREGRERIALRPSRLPPFKGDPSALLQYLLRRLLYIIPTLIGVTFLVFVSVRLIPGDPAVAIAGERATPQLV